MPCWGTIGGTRSRLERSVPPTKGWIGIELMKLGWSSHTMIVSRSFPRTSSVWGQMVGEEVHGSLSVALPNFLARSIIDLILPLFHGGGTRAISRERIASASTEAEAG